MVVVRLARRGNRKNAFYQIVVADCRCPRDGRFIERVGYYNPIAKGHKTLLQIERERIFYWLNQGAQATLRVQRLIKNLENSAKQLKKLEKTAYIAKANLNTGLSVSSSEEKAQKVKTAVKKVNTEMKK